MKKTFFAVAFAAIMGLALASCQNDTLSSLENSTVMNTRAAASYTVDNVKGDYAGRLDKVVMNGKEKNPVENQTITISANGANKFDLNLPPFKVGKMPGTIEIDAQGITLNEDGTFTATNIEKAVILKMGFIVKEYKTTLLKGKFTQTAGGYDLEFGIDSEGSLMGIPAFKAHVHFTGKK